jgi:hypothetical protein
MGGQRTPPALFHFPRPVLPSRAVNPGHGAITIELDVMNPSVDAGWLINKVASSGGMKSGVG